MAFEPRYDAKYIAPIRDNVLAQLQGQETDALWWANEGATMEPSKIWRKSRWYNTLFPVTSVIPVNTEIIESEDKSRLEERHQLLVETENEGLNADEVSDDVLKRIRALDMILRGVTNSQFIEGLVVLQAGGVVADISPHDYSYFGNPEEKSYRARASFTITISLIEMKRREV